MQKCAFPACNRFQNGIYCFNHGRVYGGTPSKPTHNAKQHSLNDLKQMAQDAVNAHVRERDKDLGCITCKTGEVTDAGHYIPVSESSALRYELDNIAGQCAKCNRMEYGERKKFRVSLISRIGKKRVEELEQTPDFYKWTKAQLEAIIDEFKVVKC